MAAHDLSVRWPTSWERECHQQRMELREEGEKLVNSLKEFNQIWR